MPFKIDLKTANSFLFLIVLFVNTTYKICVLKPILIAVYTKLHSNERKRIKFYVDMFICLTNNTNYTVDVNNREVILKGMAKYHVHYIYLQLNNKIIT